MITFVVALVVVILVVVMVVIVAGVVEVVLFVVLGGGISSSVNITIFNSSEHAVSNNIEQYFFTFIFRNRIFLYQHIPVFFLNTIDQNLAFTITSIIHIPIIFS